MSVSEIRACREIDVRFNTEFVPLRGVRMTEPEKIFVLTLSKYRFKGGALFLILWRHWVSIAIRATLLKANTEYKMTWNIP